MVKLSMERRDLRYGLLCALLVLGAMALTIPVAECGVNDDWSYNKMALDLAQTGHLIYNWWTAPMIGAQVYWGALFIKLFGFSFLAVRLSTAPLAVGCAVLLYGLHRRAGLPPGLAVLGTLAITLSPVFILNAVTFMTDVPALFFLLASVYGFVRVAGILDGINNVTAGAGALPRPFWGWLLFATVGGMLGGSIRQTGWIMPLLAPLWLLARRRTFLRLPSVRLPLILASAAALVVAVLLIAWFKNQLNVVPTDVGAGIERVFIPRVVLYLCRMAICILLTAVFLIFPLLVVLPGLYRSWQQELSLSWAQIRAVMLLAVLLGIIVWRILDYRWPFPWLDTNYILPFLLGTYPIPPTAVAPMLSMTCREGISIFFIALVSGFFAAWLATVCWRRFRTVKTEVGSSMPIPFALFVCFSIVYVPLLLLKVLFPDGFGIFDRYLLPVLPLGTIGLLTMFHRWTGRKWAPWPAWLVLALFALFGIAQAHDYFALLRARVSITGYLEQRGIPRTRILAGFEYDGWTQITAAGHNKSFAEPPKNPGFKTWYTPWTCPLVHPDYVVAAAPHPDLLDTDVPAVGYSCWLPPFHRWLLVQTSDPALAKIKSLPVRPKP
jgi:hypothetical protein